jgi:hypothetical protein
MAKKKKRTTSVVARAKSKAQKVKSGVKAKTKTVVQPRAKTKRATKTPGVLERLKKLMTE